jgi:hypothetical protein
MLWAVSQAAPLRRVHVDHDLSLYEYLPPWEFAGYASGGFLANAKVGGTVHYGSQQQWLTRNCEVGATDPLGGAFLSFLRAVAPTVTLFDRVSHAAALRLSQLQEFCG